MHQSDARKMHNWLQSENIWKSVAALKIELQMNLTLPIHEAWEAVIRRVSFGFSCSFKPINDGITIEGNPSNRPLFNETKLFARAASVWNVEPLPLRS